MYALDHLTKKVRIYFPDLVAHLYCSDRFSFEIISILETARRVVGLAKGTAVLHGILMGILASGKGVVSAKVETEKTAIHRKSQRLRQSINDSHEGMASAHGSDRVINSYCPCTLEYATGYLKKAATTDIWDEISLEYTSDLLAKYRSNSAKKVVSALDRVILTEEIFEE
jgi:hypothetical protein